MVAETSCFGIKSGKCVAGCGSMALYGPVGGKAIYCKKDKQDDHIYLGRHRCRKCGLVASFGFVGHKPICCLKHKDADHVYLKAALCIKCNKLRASFAMLGTKKSIHCSKCADKTKEYDCVHTKCTICNKIAHCGELYSKASRCIKHGHSDKHMFQDQKRFPKCRDQECKINPLYTSRSDGYPEVCFMHKLNSDIPCRDLLCSGCECPSEYRDVVSKKCPTCQKIDRQTVMLSGDIVPRYRHIEELSVRQLLEDECLVANSYDKTLPEPGCCNYRPDIFFYALHGHHSIIVEVDEGQHKDRPLDCEYKRMAVIQQTLATIEQDPPNGGTVFLRYNPGSWVDDAENRHKQTATDRCLLPLLIKQLQKADPFEGLVVCLLYFDHWKGHPEFFLVDYFNHITYDWKPTFSRRYCDVATTPSLD